MIDPKNLNAFTKEVNGARSQFCVRKYCNNQFAKYQNQFNSTVIKKRSTKEDPTKNFAQYKNFWSVTIPTLQQGWILAIARLVDRPSYKKDKTKTNLSVYYIIELLDDTELQEELRSTLIEHTEFTDQIEKLRKKSIAHKDLNHENYKIIKPGIEDFFETLENVISLIISKYSELRSCDKPNLKFTEKLSAQ